MLKKTKFAKSIVLAVIISVTFALGCHFTQETIPPDAGSGCNSGPHEITTAMVNSWFESGAASLNGVVNPANSILFADIPNCTFYQWSAQMFLWLTSPAPARYGSGGLVMNTPAFYDVSLPDSTGQRTFQEHTPGLIRAFNLRTAQKGSLDLPIVLEKKTLRVLEILPPVLSATGKQLVMDKGGKEIEIGSVKLNSDKRPMLLDIKGQEIQEPRAIIQSVTNEKMVSPITEKLRKIENFDKTSLVQKFTIGESSFFLDLFGSFHEEEQGQADGSVLMAQNGSLVYYSLTVNNVYALYRTMQGASVPAGTKFPITQANLNSISAFAAANGKSPIIDSIALAIEIKCSWIEAKGLMDSNKFIRMTAIVPTYDKSNPNDWVPNGTKTVELAMVGMHVVGSTGSTNPANTNHGHPELLWATFEHLSNDPAAGYSYLTNGGGTTPIPQNTTGTWNFCANGATGPFNVAHMMMGGADGTHIVPTMGHTISPTNILRVKPWGLDSINATGNAEVISTNNVVRSVLDTNDVRRNYIQTGTTWSIFGRNPTPANQVGTNILSNTTMETFAQPTNCFSCHNTNTTAVSHIFDDTKPLF